MKELKKIIGMNLKYYRYKSGLSQEKFYSEHKLNPKYFSRVECGKENVSLAYIEEIAEKIKVEAKDLITFNPDHVIEKKRIDEKEKIKS